MRTATAYENGAAVDRRKVCAATDDIGNDS